MRIRMKACHHGLGKYPGNVFDLQDEELARRLIAAGNAEEAPAPVPPPPPVTPAGDAGTEAGAITLELTDGGKGPGPAAPPGEAASQPGAP